MLVDDDGRLSGIFTDSDLARLFENHRDGELDNPVRTVMTADPSTIRSGSMMSEAVELMAEKKISELPVVDQRGNPLGLVDVTDVVGLLPVEEKSKSEQPPATYRVFREPTEGEKT